MVLQPLWLPCSALDSEDWINGLFEDSFSLKSHRSCVERCGIYTNLGRPRRWYGHRELSSASRKWRGPHISLKSPDVTVKLPESNLTHSGKSAANPPPWWVTNGLWSGSAIERTNWYQESGWEIQRGTFLVAEIDPNQESPPTYIGVSHGVCRERCNFVWYTKASDECSQRNDEKYRKYFTGIVRELLCRGEDFPLFWEGTSNYWAV